MYELTACCQDLCLHFRQVSYSESDTATRRLRIGASGQPSIPEKTREIAARRAGSTQPSASLANQAISTQKDWRQDPQPTIGRSAPAPAPSFGYGQNVPGTSVFRY